MRRCGAKCWYSTSLTCFRPSDIMKNSVVDFLKVGWCRQLVQKQLTEKHNCTKAKQTNIRCLAQTLPCSSVHSLTILPFAGLHPSRPDPQQEEETAGHHQMAGSRERQAFLGFPLLLPLLLGIQLPLWADWALHAAGEGGSAKGFVHRHILLYLHSLTGGHEWL